MCKTYTLNASTSEDFVKSRSWVGDFFTSPEKLPISFIYGGKKTKGIPIEWNTVTQKRRIDSNIIEKVFEGRDSATGLNIRVESLEYFDYPVIEWTAWFTNMGSGPTPLISNVLALDSDFEGNLPAIYHCNGDFYSEDGYTPEETPLNNGDILNFAPTGGRPCDRAFPYYRIMFENCGMTIAIGWPAQWSASFSGLENGVHVKAGQEKTNLQLMPGETIRTPRMTVMSWDGNTGRAVNLWRRWYLDHVLPKPDGRPIQPKMALAGTDEGEEFTQATEENQLRFIEKAMNRGFKFDVWWIDAGWYPCFREDIRRRSWPVTGTWKPDPERFPNGLKPVSDYALKNGADLLIWFEPERVRRGTQIDTEHPEWLFKKKDKPEERERLLNLGNPECRCWLTDHICKLIQENGIKIYRQDFNFEPLDYWRQNEDENRKGINENFHVQGYLQFWDDLLERNPGLWIDSCSSGGRRNDMETMRRSVPLHYTDYGYGIHAVKLAFHHTLYSWIPYFKECTLSWDINPEKRERYDDKIDSFSYHCGMAPMIFPTFDIKRDDYDFSIGLKMIEIWRKASSMLLNGDYYPLTPFSNSNDKWLVWQFDMPETGEGLIQGFRFSSCPEESITIYPKVFCRDVTYLFENPESKKKIEVSGAELQDDGFTFKLPQNSAEIWFYRNL